MAVFLGTLNLKSATFEGTEILPSKEGIYLCQRYPRRMKLLVDSLVYLFNVRSPSSLLIFSIIGYLRFHVLPDGNSLGYIKLHERCIANHYVNSNAPFLCIYSLLNEEYCVSLFNYIYKNTLGVYHAPKDFFGDIIV